MFRCSTSRILIASLGSICLSLNTATAQQGGVIVSGNGVGSAIVSGPNGTQGVAIDSQGRVHRFRQNAPTTGNAVGAFSGGGSTGIVTGDFDPFNFVFGHGGFPGPASRPDVTSTLIDLDAIKTAYIEGDYTRALQLASADDDLFPNDPEIQQLHALALFALGRYPEAGRALHDTLSSGRIWTWSTLRQFHPSNEAYLNHYQALRAAAAAPHASPNTALLLAYHDLVLGRLEAARQSCRNILTTNPDNQVARTLLETLPPDPTSTPLDR